MKLNISKIMHAYILRCLTLFVVLGAAALIGNGIRDAGACIGVGIRDAGCLLEQGLRLEGIGRVERIIEDRDNYQKNKLQRIIPLPRAQPRRN